MGNPTYIHRHSSKLDCCIPTIQFEGISFQIFSGMMDANCDGTTTPRAPKRYRASSGRPASSQRSPKEVLLLHRSRNSRIELLGEDMAGFGFRILVMCFANSLVYVLGMRRNFRKTVDISIPSNQFHAVQLTKSFLRI